MVLSSIEIVALLLSITSVFLVLLLGMYGYRRLRRIEARGWQGGERTSRVFDLDMEEGLESDAKQVGNRRTAGRGSVRRGDSVRMDRVGRREGGSASGSVQVSTRPTHHPPIILNVNTSHLPPSSSSLSIPTNSTHRKSSSSEATPNSRTSIIGKGRRVLSKRRRGSRIGGPDDSTTALKTRRLKDRFGVGTQMDYGIGESDSSENRPTSSEQHRLSGPEEVQPSSRTSGTSSRTPPSSPDYRSSMTEGEKVESPRQSIDFVPIFTPKTSDETHRTSSLSKPRRRDSTLRPTPSTTQASMIPLLTLTPNSPTSPLTPPLIFPRLPKYYSSADLYSGSSGSESDHFPSSSSQALPSDPHEIFSPPPPPLPTQSLNSPPHSFPPPRPPSRSLTPSSPSLLPPPTKSTIYGLSIPHLRLINSVGSLESSSLPDHMEEENRGRRSEKLIAVNPDERSETSQFSRGK